ncbi:MAG: polyphosphate kinase 1 [Candidatus Hydrogenedens sp.]|nr:polyphosphate kinase 1 [Candidatus Hydrogenedens sp.]
MHNQPQIREISVLSFNERVLQEAEDTRNPLLERLKFLGIFSSNMDEFYKVRVASIHRRAEMGKRGMKTLLEVISDKTRELDERFRVAYAGITTDLAAEGIRIIDERDLMELPRETIDWVDTYFRQKVLPGLVPLIVERERRFPQLSDGGLYLGVKMLGASKRYAILEIPPTLPRFVSLPGGYIMYVDDIIRHTLNEIFYIFDYAEIAAWEFKISRDAELDMDNDFSEGYVRKMEKVLAQRKGGRPTRFVYDARMPKGLQQILKRELQLTNEDTNIPGGRYHNMKDLMDFPSNRPDLLFPHYAPAPHPVLDRDRRPLMDTIRERDLLVTYPYQSFDHVIRLLREAAIDPQVTNIKISLYRVAKDSQVVNALYNAARNGKKVVANIELLARFDEENNIHTSNRLNEVGARVLYGVPPMKVHSKIALIERGGTRIAALSTGNMNEKTGRLYVDSMLLTADKRLTREVAEVFDYLEETASVRVVTPPRFKHLLVSPFNSRKRWLSLIDRETKKGTAGYIFIKVNHLTDKRVVSKLRDAAAAGVRMDLVIRTTSAMRPHPNIRAISVLDRYLEHQRVYIFGQGEGRQIFMSSADLMERNLDWRIEVAFPIYDEALQREVQHLMALQVADTYKARVLDEEQSNHYVGGKENGMHAQLETQRYYHALWDAANTPETTEDSAPRPGSAVS